jgi:hypothetical protein
MTPNNPILRIAWPRAHVRCVAAAYRKRQTTKRLQGLGLCRIARLVDSPLGLKTPYALLWPGGRWRWHSVRAMATSRPSGSPLDCCSDGGL